MSTKEFKIKILFKFGRTFQIPILWLNFSNFLLEYIRQCLSHFCNIMFGSVVRPAIEPDLPHVSDKLINIVVLFIINFLLFKKQ